MKFNELASKVLEPSFAFVIQIFLTSYFYSFSIFILKYDRWWVGVCLVEIGAMEVRGLSIQSCCFRKSRRCLARFLFEYGRCFLFGSFRRFLYGSFRYYLFESSRFHFDQIKYGFLFDHLRYLCL